MIYRTNNPKETEKLAGFLLKEIWNKPSKKAVVVAMEGELGAGKTVFVRGLAGKLGIKEKIKSPTFTLMKKYPVRNSISFKFLYHFDCYRLKDHTELDLFGIDEILNNPENIVLIEWSDRVRRILPKRHIKIHIDHISEKERKISVK